MLRLRNPARDRPGGRWGAFPAKGRGRCREASSSTPRSVTNHFASTGSETKPEGRGRWVLSLPLSRGRTVPAAQETPGGHAGRVTWWSALWPDTEEAALPGSRHTRSRRTRRINGYHTQTCSDTCMSTHTCMYVMCVHTPRHTHTYSTRAFNSGQEMGCWGKV